MNNDPISGEQVDAHRSTPSPTALHVPKLGNQSLAEGPGQTSSEEDIPVLNDIVAEPAIYRPVLASTHHEEPSADDELARTNKYKTLSERDLERAEAANDTAVAEPPAADAKVQMLMLDECLIDDDLEIDFDDDNAFEDSLSKLEQELDTKGETNQKCQAILPDLDKLNAELGVDPLPPEPESADPATGAIVALAPVTAPLQPSPFAISASTVFTTPDTPFCFAAPDAEPPNQFPSGAELEAAVNEALAQALPALQQAVLQTLVPLLGKDSPQKA